MNSGCFKMLSTKCVEKSYCECRSLRFNRYSFLDWTLPPAPVASGWKVQEELSAWILADSNSVFFKLTGMRDWRFSLWVPSKAKRGKHANSLELIRFKSSLLWCVYFFGTFMSAFVLFQFSRWGMYACFTLNKCANKDIHLHVFEFRVFDFWYQLLLLNIYLMHMYKKDLA